MKRNIITMLCMFFLAITSCSKKDDDKASLVGEGVAETIVFGGKVVDINECTSQTRVSISEKQLSQYYFYQRNGECSSIVTTFDYVKENNYLKDVLNNSGFLFSLEDNNTRLRLSQTSSNYVIFKRK